jgi:hypothetical protein
MVKLVTYFDGDKYYYDENDKCHNDDGPAIITNLSKCYFFHGKRHRLDGPAVEGIGSESHIKEWWYMGMHIVNCKSQKEFEKFLKLKIFW